VRALVGSAARRLTASPESARTRTPVPSRPRPTWRTWVTALLAVARRDTQVTMSYRGMVFSRPLGAIFTLALFYYVSRLVGASSRFATADEYIAFVAIGIVIQGFIRSTLGVPLAVRRALVAGSYERREMTGFGGTAGPLGVLLSTS